MHNKPYQPDPEADDTPSGSTVVYVFLAVCIFMAVMAALILTGAKS